MLSQSHTVPPDIGAYIALQAWPARHMPTTVKHASRCCQVQEFPAAAAPSTLVGLPGLPHGLRIACSRQKTSLQSNSSNADG